MAVQKKKRINIKRHLLNSSRTRLRLIKDLYEIKPALYLYTRAFLKS